MKKGWNRWDEGLGGVEGRLLRFLSLFLCSLPSQQEVCTRDLKGDLMGVIRGHRFSRWAKHGCMFQIAQKKNPKTQKPTNKQAPKPKNQQLPPPQKTNKNPTFPWILFITVNLTHSFRQETAACWECHCITTLPPLVPSAGFIFASWLQCHVLLYKLQKSRMLENIHIFYQCWLMCNYFLCYLKEGGYWKKWGGERGGNKPNQLQKQKTHPRIWEKRSQGKMSWDLSSVCEIHFILAMLPPNSDFWCEPQFSSQYLCDLLPQGLPPIGIDFPDVG